MKSIYEFIYEDREEEDSDKDAKYYQQCSATLKRRQNVWKVRK